MDTTNGTVVAFKRIDPVGGKDYEWLNPCVIDPNNNHLMYLAGGKYLWRNNDLSAIPLSNMWDSISTNWVQWPDSVPITGADITAMAVSTSPANILYYGTSDREVYRITGANTGTPTAVDITSKTGTNAFPAGPWNGADPFVTCIAVDPDSGKNLMVVFSNYGAHNLFYSSSSESLHIAQVTLTALTSPHCVGLPFNISLPEEQFIGLQPAQVYMLPTN